MSSETVVNKAMEGLQLKMKELKGTEKRDTLRAGEQKYQKLWQERGFFRVDAPSIKDIPLDSIPAADLRERYPKFFGTMPYPYMNGRLHAGHGFSVSKLEFAAGSARMLGKRVLFPMGFHCSGMPIKACADKIVDEMKMFGTQFENYEESASQADKSTIDLPQKREDVTKFSSKKSKAVSKTGSAKYQFQILEMLGIKREEISKFAKTDHWLAYFPPLAVQDLSSLGCRIDWRRSFITTDANPYYDAFVRWQMNRLKELGKVRFGKRYSIYCIKDGQPCMDHDRSEGEGVNPQEYTALKLRVLEWAPKAHEALAGKFAPDSNVFLVPATLRPETMYGQTCCFVGPKLLYGVFRATEKDFYIVTDRAARNMAHQGVFSSQGIIDKVAEIAGSDLIGTLVRAPLSLHKDGVRILPMDSVLATKGTGVVTSVPSDSPDDFATVTELAKKPEFYGIRKEWAELEIFPILETPLYGDLTAPFLVKQMKIQSPKDAKQLEEAKELAYKEGFFQGVMKVGEFKGEKVQNVKAKIQKKLIDSGEAFVYSEPERKVVSRSGDDCIVALTDQWYLDYGEETWKNTALDWMNSEMETFGEETQRAYEGGLSWLEAHPCVRSYGLGTKLPWDPSELVESLSDSTIYMSYYTIAHLLHEDLYGQVKGPAGVEASQMTDEVWDYVFCRRDLDASAAEASKIPIQTLQTMRREFEYFYPLDVRFTAKDLQNNHMLYFLYCHVAIFKQEYWPRGIRINGHLQINGEKMSKSTGNFISLQEMVEKYGADASRIALADAGDATADGNLEEDVADKAVLRLFNFREWGAGVMANEESLRVGELNSFQDALFSNEMNAKGDDAKRHYANMHFRLALRAAFYDLMAARDFYRESCAAAGVAMHRGLIWRYLELQSLLMAVIAPHWAEYIWVELLQKKSSIQETRFPDTGPADATLSATMEYVRKTASSVNSAEALQLKKKAKGKGVQFDPSKPKKLTVYTTDKYPAWQSKYVELLSELRDPLTGAINDTELSARMLKLGEMKKAMPFVQEIRRRLDAGQSADEVLQRKLAFDEVQTLRNMSPGLLRSAGLAQLSIVAMEEAGGHGGGPQYRGVDVATGRAVDTLAPGSESAMPSDPFFYFENE